MKREKGKEKPIPKGAEKEKPQRLIYKKREKGKEQEKGKGKGREMNRKEKG